MNKLLLIFTFFYTIACKAQQQVFPLNAPAYKLPSNSYFKDSNNELDYYVGTWKGIFQDKTITLQISKQIKVKTEFLNKNFYTDQLFARYEVKKNGIIVESSLNKDFTNDVGLSIKSAYTQDNGSSVTLLFSGGNCSVGIGTIVLKKISITQFSWGYYPGTTTTIDSLCPPNLDYTIYLPETENLVFTKQ